MGKNYTIIHGNLIYKVENVVYDSSATHRIFKRSGEMILSVPKNSTLIENGQGVTAKPLPITQPTERLTSMSETPPAVHIEGSDNFVEGMIAGAIIHEIFFD